MMQIWGEHFCIQKAFFRNRTAVWLESMQVENKIILEIRGPGQPLLLNMVTFLEMEILQKESCFTKKAQKQPVSERDLTK